MSQQSSCPECGFAITIAADTVKGEILQCGDTVLVSRYINPAAATSMNVAGAVAAIPVQLMASSLAATRRP